MSTILRIAVAVLLPCILGTAVRAQDMNAGSANVGSQIGTGMGGFHGAGLGGGFYHPSWGPSMPGYTMPHTPFPTPPPFNGNLVTPVTPFAPLNRPAIGYGFDRAGLHEKPQFGPSPEFNNRPSAGSVSLAPHYIPGFFASSHNYPEGAEPKFNALPKSSSRNPWDTQSRPTAAKSNKAWPNQYDPRWWPRSQLDARGAGG
jgi:hypothetical protein